MVVFIFVFLSHACELSCFIWSDFSNPMNWALWTGLRVPVQPYGQGPRLPCPWNSPGKNTGVSCYALLQGIFPIQEKNRCFFCLLNWQAGSLPLAQLDDDNRAYTHTISILGTEGIRLFYISYTYLMATKLNSWQKSEKYRFTMSHDYYSSVY